MLEKWKKEKWWISQPHLGVVYRVKIGKWPEFQSTTKCHNVINQKKLDNKTILIATVAKSMQLFINNLKNASISCAWIQKQRKHLPLSNWNFNLGQTRKITKAAKKNHKNLQLLNNHLNPSLLTYSGYSYFQPKKNCFKIQLDYFQKKRVSERRPRKENYNNCTKVINYVVSNKCA